MSKNCLWQCRCGLQVKGGYSCPSCGEEEVVPHPCERFNMFIDSMEEAIDDVSHSLGIRGGSYD